MSDNNKSIKKHRKPTFKNPITFKISISSGGLFLINGMYDYLGEITFEHNSRTKKKLFKFLENIYFVSSDGDLTKINAFKTLIFSDSLSLAIEFLLLEKSDPEYSPSVFIGYKPRIEIFRI